MIQTDAGCKISQFRLVKGVIKHQWSQTFCEGEYAKAIDLKENVLVAGFSSAVIKLIDRETQKVIADMQSELGVGGHTNRIFCVKFSKDTQNLLISGGWDTAIRLWDIRTKSSVSSILGTFVCGESLDLDAKKILVGNDRSKDKLQIFDIRTSGLLEIIPFEGPEGISSCVFDYYRKGLVLAVSGHTLKIFNLGQLPTVIAEAELCEAGQYIAMSQRGEIAVACNKGKGHLFSL